MKPSGWVWAVLACLFVLAAIPLPVAFAQQASTVLAPTATIGTAKRVALVIGNAAYQNVHALQNPGHDAQAMAEKLRGLGYEVRFILNADRRSMNGAVLRFMSDVTPDSEALIYYSGHGVELGGSNYLLPTDIPAISPDDDGMLRTEALNLTELLLEVQEKRARVALVIVDACRDNPFRVASIGGTLKSVGNLKGGLAAVEPPQGSFVIYAAGVGQQAMDNLGSDDTDPNGLFTRKLLALMDQDGLEIRPLIQKLRAQVSQAAYATHEHHSQVPGYYDQLLGDFYFRPKASEAQVGVVPAPVSPIPSSLPVQPASIAVSKLEPSTHSEPTECERLVNADATTEMITAPQTDIGAIAEFCREAAERFPNVVTLTQLSHIAEEQSMARTALLSIVIGPSNQYLEIYPNGRFAADVRTHLASLTPGIAPPPTSDPSVTPLNPVVAPPTQAELTRSLREELKRVGCYTGNMTGEWDRSSVNALQKFGRNTNKAIPIQAPSLDALKIVRSYSGRVCSLNCGRGKREDGEECVSIVCNKGTRMGNDGKCHAISVQTPSKEIKTASGIGRRAKESCFIFMDEKYFK